jgi:hypothetical protein
LATAFYLDGDFVLKGGTLTVVNKKPGSINSIHSWSTDFMIFMDIMLEQWPFSFVLYEVELLELGMPNLAVG